MDKLRAIIYGVGEMGRESARILDTKGARIVAAIGNRSNIGRDLGEVAGLGHRLDVPIRNDAEKVLAETDADIVLMTVGTSMEQMMPHFERCLKAGFNVVTIAEEAFYPWQTAGDLAEQLDHVAKQHGVTLTAGGIQDVLWLNLLRALTGGCSTIRNVLGVAVNNVDEYGPIAAKETGVGLTEEAFIARQRAGEGELDFFGISLELITQSLGLHITSRTSSMVPVLAKEKIFCRSLQQNIDGGQVIGTVQVTEVTTSDGSVFRTEFYTKILEEGEHETSSWYITGDPDLSFEMKDVPGPAATCAAMINRIPDVINAPPGLVMVDALPPLAYRPKPLHMYVK